MKKHPMVQIQILDGVTELTTLNIKAKFGSTVEEILANKNDRRQVEDALYRGYKLVWSHKAV